MQHKKLNFLIIIPILLITLGQVSAKHGMNLFQDNNKIYYSIIFLSIGYMALILRGVIWIVILKKHDLSSAYPLISLSYVFIILLSYFLFSEPLSIEKITGALLIIIGVLLIGRNEYHSGN